MIDLQEEVVSTRRILTQWMAELAFIQEQLSGPRMARKRAREDIAAACLVLDHTKEVVRSWRCMTPEELERWDAVNRRFTAPEIRELLTREKDAKEAVRLAGIEHDDAVEAVKTGRAGYVSNRRTNRRNRRKTGAPPVAPSPTGERTGAAPPLATAEPAQGVAQRALPQGDGTPHPTLFDGDDF